VTPTRHGSEIVEFPDELSILITRAFDAPIALVFDVLTKPEHVTRWFFERELKECAIDLQVGGSYRYVYVNDDGGEMVFSGTFLEIDPPTRTVETWLYDGWPDADALETVDLVEVGGVTTMTIMLAFGDRAGRDHMTTLDGFVASLDRTEDLLRSLLDERETVSG
jgi:uncharacterized protein YndB with AHSA1/START domain